MLRPSTRHAVPKPTLWIDVQPVEVTYNKRQWDALFKWLSKALNRPVVPRSCQVWRVVPTCSVVR